MLITLGARQPRVRFAVVLSMWMLAAIVWPGTAIGQTPGGVSVGGGDPDRPLPGWVGEFTILSSNAVLGGLTAGIARWIRGGSFGEGFASGFAGGATIYVGKRIAASEPPGAGAMGRAVAAVGGSVVRNASEGRPALEQLVVPVGPVRMYIDRSARPRVRAKVDLNTLVMVGYAATKRELDFDLGRSLSAGTPVFRAPGHLLGTSDDTVRASGRVVENVVLLSDLEWRDHGEEREIFAHERVHVLQRDQVFATIAEPLGAAVVARIPQLGGLYRYVDIHFTDLVVYGLAAPFGAYQDRPWEMEAFHLSGQREER